MDITDLGHDVFQIDTRMAGYQGITAGYLIRGSRPCLVETGTAPSAPVVRAALSELGVHADDLASVVVTHIHLDHAGGAGDIAAMYPAAEIVVHQRGERAQRGKRGLQVEVRWWRGGPQVSGFRDVDARRVAHVQIAGQRVEQADVMHGVPGGVVAGQLPAVTQEIGRASCRERV